MCHVNQGPDWSGFNYAPGKRHPAPPGVDPQVLADQQAAIAAGAAVSDWKRRRAASALQAGSRGLIGQRSVLGAAATTPATARAGIGQAGSYGGSVLGNLAGGASGAGR